MPTLRTLLAQLQEATYARDASVRAQAERFFRDLFAYLDVPTETLAKRIGQAEDGTFYVKSRAFTDQGPDDLLVLLAPGDGRTKASVGRYRGKPVLVLRVLRGAGDLTYVASRTTQDAVVHELVHLLDPGHTRGSGSAQRADAGDMAGYYNTPAEWNAYWQEGASSAERMLRGAGQEHAQVRDFFFGGSLQQFAQKVDRLWDKDFLAAMDATTRRKFDKRLAALWQQWKDEGLL